MWYAMHVGMRMRVYIFARASLVCMRTRNVCAYRYCTYCTLCVNITLLRTPTHTQGEHTPIKSIYSDGRTQVHDFSLTHTHSPHRVSWFEASTLLNEGKVGLSVLRNSMAQVSVCVVRLCARLWMRDQVHERTFICLHPCIFHHTTTPYHTILNYILYYTIPHHPKLHTILHHTILYYTKIVPERALRLFTPKELKLQVCGAPEINIELLQRNTGTYRVCV
jgi:hypothetical protein